MQYIDSIVFIFIASLTLLFALGSIVLQNTIYAVLSLICTVVGLAILMIFSGSDFLGISIVIIYVGAVAVLMLFVIMMLDNTKSALGSIDFGTLSKILLILGAGGGMVYMVMVHNNLYNPQLVFLPEKIHNNIEWIGLNLYKNYALQFQMAGMILFSAIVGVVALIQPRFGEEIGKKSPSTLIKDRVFLHDIGVGEGARIFNNTNNIT